MSNSKDVKFSLRVFLHKQKTKVLFAEVESDFADVLLSFLTLPLGTIVRVLKKHYGEGQETHVVNIGSLTNLYDSLSNLDGVYFWTEGCKEVLLNPTSSFRDECRKLKLDISETQPTEHFTCPLPKCYASCNMDCLSVYYDTSECNCGRKRVRKIGPQAINRAGGIFTVDIASFIISDDLRVFPNSTGFIHTLRNLGITDMDLGELRIVTFGFSEIMDLLKGSLFSGTPLSDVILNKRQVDHFATVKCEPRILSLKEKEATSNSKKIILKIMVRKSTNKLLFARAGQDFMDFLCSLFAIPFGAVEYLLGGNTSLKAIDNLYRSIVMFIDESHLATPYIKNRLIKGKLRHGYISKFQILPLTEERFCYSTDGYVPEMRNFSSVNFVKGPGKYIRGPTMYKITDDLTVTPFCMASILLGFKEQNIHLSDVQEWSLR
ncbi:PREDICTED: uncharacterized protein LOC105964378 [Erythranthe guttata]|nr:PREDICTED: uncharacterized protein LOC105964378 [Erythranthe guttata]|eukprot:XP_012844356.1 PREDICTED: uncharacterized protein LOC105964378 [Erythranthe guttata]